MGKIIQDLRDIVWASRVQKALPLVLMILAPASLQHHDIDWLQIFFACIGVTSIIVLGNQLNVLTDRQLDKASKPQLYARLATNLSLLRALQVVELSISICVIFLILLMSNGQSVFGLLILYVLSILYSYNFLSRQPGPARLKLHWLGNFLSIYSSYLVIGIIGALSTIPKLTSHEIFSWTMLAASLAASSYGLFLTECAQDAQDEAAAGLQTLPALLGRRRTSLVGICFSFLGYLSFCYVIVENPYISFWPALISLLPCYALQFAATVYLFLRTDPAFTLRMSDRLLDWVFWLSRLWPLLCFVYNCI